LNEKGIPALDRGLFERHRGFITAAGSTMSTIAKDGSRIEPFVLRASATLREINPFSVCV
jgi:hypothetical protein